MKHSLKKSLEKLEKALSVEAPRNKRPYVNPCPNIKCWKTDSGQCYEIYTTQIWNPVDGSCSEGTSGFTHIADAPCPPVLTPCNESA